ncbi:MAG: 50S ribosomal protein L30 [Saccharofermentanales bacterium]|jgi:large subunit ribosomal protein L30|nr:50S ribosomal protein L30 [Clostridiaceae bacterium]
MARVIITQIKSTNNANKNHIATIRALGLKKIGQTVEHEATPSIMGMVRRVAHLVRCEEV